MGQMPGFDSLAALLLPTVLFVAIVATRYTLKDRKGGTRMEKLIESIADTVLTAADSVLAGIWS